MNPKYIYALIALVVVVGGAAILLKSKTTNAPNQEQMGDQYSNNNNSGTNNNMTDTNTPVAPVSKQEKGCEPGTDFSGKDAKGRFKPTISLANKTAVLDTSMGKIEIQFFDKDAPKTVQNFVCLVQRGYFDNIKFHRVAHGFVIQAGDPTGTGSGGESIYGAKFEDELYADTPSYQTGYIKGTVAMANAGANTNGSQFFIMLDDLNLPHNYTIFGKVSAGMDIVAKIGAVQVKPVFSAEDGSPVTDIIINKAIIK